MSGIVDTLRAQQGFFSGKAPSAEQVQSAEATLGLRFAEDYREYVSALGIASYDGHELTGVCAFPRLSVVTVTERERATLPAVPNDWYVIEQTHIDDVVIWQDASGAVYQTIAGLMPQRICESLSEYVTL